jgi:HD superfamily phosphodiesterase
MERDIWERLIGAMEGVFGEDERRISHARKVLDYAERIMAAEGGCDEVTVVAGAVLHDIGIREAEAKHGSSAPRFQEMEGPPIARGILEELGFDAERIEHVCRIVGSHHSGGDIDTAAFRVVWDADWLVNIPEEYGELEVGRLQALVEKVFRTEAGRRIAEALFLSSD